jgi:hypothetical protein
MVISPLQLCHKRRNLDGSAIQPRGVRSHMFGKTGYFQSSVTALAPQSCARRRNEPIQPTNHQRESDRSMPGLTPNRLHLDPYWLRPSFRSGRENTVGQTSSHQPHIPESRFPTNPDIIYRNIDKLAVVDVLFLSRITWDHSNFARAWQRECCHHHRHFTHNHMSENHNCRSISTQIDAK